MNRREHPGPWSEADFFALGETRERIELIDGELVVSPSPTRPHQHIARRLTDALDRAAGRSNLTAYMEVDVRLAPGRILIPDAVVGKLSWEAGVADATDVLLACEVTSPGNAAFDRTRKMACYAEAGIAWYLLADPDMTDFRSLELRLYRLDNGRYVEHTVARFGQTLVSDDPFPLAIPTTSLIRQA